MLKNKYVLVTIVILALTLSAYALQAADSSTPVSHGDVLGGYLELVNALRDTGAQVEPTESI